MVLVQRVHHGCRVRPISRVPAGDVVERTIVCAGGFCPPVVVDDQRIQRNFLFAEGVQCFQKLVLAAVSVAGLHISERILRQHGGFAGDGTIAGDHRIRIRTVKEVVIHTVGRQPGVAIGGVAVLPLQLPIRHDVEQNAVAHVGIEHRRALAGVGLLDPHRLTFDAHGAVDIAEPVQRFVFVGDEALGDLVGRGVVFERDGFGGTVTLRQNQIARRIAVGHFAGGFINDDGELSCFYRQHIVCFGNRKIVEALVVIYGKGHAALVRQLVAGRPAHINSIGGAYRYFHDGAINIESQHVLFFLLGWGIVRGGCVHQPAGQQHAEDQQTA